MQWVYVLKSDLSERLYIGTTNNLSRRIQEHNEGLVFSTRSYKPWKLVYVEGYRSKEDAYTRESRLKQYKQAYTRLKERIDNSLRHDEY